MLLFGEIYDLFAISFLSVFIRQRKNFFYFFRIHHIYKKQIVRSTVVIAVCANLFRISNWEGKRFIYLTDWESYILFKIKKIIAYTSNHRMLSGSFADNIRSDLTFCMNVISNIKERNTLNCISQEWFELILPSKNLFVLSNVWAFLIFHLAIPLLEKWQKIWNALSWIFLFSSSQDNWLSSQS